MFRKIIRFGYDASAYSFLKNYRDFKNALCLQVRIVELIERGLSTTKLK